jgi:[protein-PII] uridylyltransferase
LKQLAQAMREQLLTPQPGRDFLKTVMPRALKHFPITTRVVFSDSHNGAQTIMEVAAQDRPGLLHQVALALQHCKAQLVTAKIATYGERAEDIFFLTGRDGRALNDAAQVECLKHEILARLEDNSSTSQLLEF